MPYLPNLKACKSYDLQAFYFDIFCGVGENRTLVQTSNQKAFYTLSFILNFRLKARLETATFNLALSVSERI